jgi:hypothetical protein
MYIYNSKKMFRLKESLNDYNNCDMCGMVSYTIFEKKNSVTKVISV